MSWVWCQDNFKFKLFCISREGFHTVKKPGRHELEHRIKYNISGSGTGALSFLMHRTKSIALFL